MPSDEQPAGGVVPDCEALKRENASLRAQVEFLNRKLQLVGSITRHDVLNQLTAVVGYNELMGMMVQDPKLKSFLDKEKTAIDKIRRQFTYAKDYQNIAVEPPRWQNIRNTVTLVSEMLNLGEVKAVVETGDAAVLADSLFIRAVFHLFDNTLRHAETATTIRVTITATADGALLVIEDNGRGVQPNDKEKIFERGFGKGTGWGLFVVREVLAVTGMTIRETGTPGTGARFEILVPNDRVLMSGIE